VTGPARLIEFPRPFLIVLAAVVLVALSACSREGPSFKTSDVTGSAIGGGPLALTDSTGKARTLADFRGKAVVVFFGYTQCPDVCPTTMAELTQVKKLLGAEGDRLQAIFVSVDPERDTPQILKAYMQSFDPAFVALRGTPEQVSAVAKEFKVFYAKVGDKAASAAYTVDHTAGAYIFDTQGRVRLFTRYGTGAPALAADIKRLLQQPA